MVRLAKASSYWMEDDSVEVAVRGSYLKQFGFDVGTRVVIEVTDGLITIKPVDGEDD